MMVSGVDVSAEYLDLEVLAQLFNALLQQYGQEVGFLSARQAKLGAKLSVVPASDWAGIDPAHALPARFRAMEQGLPLVRPARWATSAAFDARGKVLARAPPTGGQGLVMLADVPVLSIYTTYSIWSDLPIVLFAAALLVASAAAACGKRRPFPSS
jgi:apolipoprotein N-acyltransferase